MTSPRYRFAPLLLANPRRKLTPPQVKAIRRELRISDLQWARICGVSHMTIKRVRDGVTYKEVTP